jgi:beta-lactam-binding protein with PASTA domain
VQAGTLQVFLSYAHQDRERVAMIARSLEGRGLRVMDRSVEPGTDWSSVVSQQLDASDAILVFWSRAAVESRTIMAEAEEGLRRGILVPVLLEDVAPPLAFRSVQSADLRRPTADAIEKLADAVERVAAATPGTVIVPTPFVPSAPVPIAPAPAHRPLRLAIAATVALVAVLGVGGWIAFRSFGSSSGDSPAPQAVAMVTVPDFVGAATSDASKTAELIGLTLAMTDGRGGQGTFFDGVVTKQSPAPGASVARLAKVELEVAAQTVTVPTLVGTSLDTALQTLDRNRLQLGKTLSQPVADRKPGTIVRQTPAPGEMVAAGSTVDVFVATVPRPTRRTLTVPNFIGATTSAAEAQASRLGIKLTKTDAHGAPMPGSATGLVVSQSRAPNSQMGANETLQIGVTQRGTVPNLLGLASVDAASSILGALGLRLGNIQYRSAAGIARGAIIAQSPSPGVSVREGSSVMVVVASGK